MSAPHAPQGYGTTAKVLHWLTVVALLTQLVVGLTMDTGTAVDRAEQAVDRAEDRGEEAAEQQGEAAEERFEAEIERREDAADRLDDEAGSQELRDVASGSVLDDGVSGVEVHVLLGLGIFLLGVVRLVRRRVVALPPWAEHLGPGQRRLEGLMEKAMLALLLVVPASGLLLALAGESFLVLHVGTQVVLGVVVATHVGLVLWHTVVRRHGHLSRML
ncbi:cytochrome b/b6 domain-containing protein [Aeromicrobium massiliense]|uniref:cytochrome b/b6 domain-containing protein n=1 Tax=Aeromicrobium massiliense TaxID=1464554 RepID=UPI00030EDE71|nr:cytochrome b/b6 domain-containing protein [Aeromicrobium massiliense]